MRGQLVADKLRQAAFRLPPGFFPEGFKMANKFFAQHGFEVGSELRGKLPTLRVAER